MSTQNILQSFCKTILLTGLVSIYCSSKHKSKYCENNPANSIENNKKVYNALTPSLKTNNSSGNAISRENDDDYNQHDTEHVKVVSTNNFADYGYPRVNNNPTGMTWSQATDSVETHNSFKANNSSYAAISRENDDDYNQHDTEPVQPVSANNFADYGYPRVNNNPTGMTWSQATGSVETHNSNTRYATVVSNTGNNNAQPTQNDKLSLNQMTNTQFIPNEYNAVYNGGQTLLGTSNGFYSQAAYAHFFSTVNMFSSQNNPQPHQFPFIAQSSFKFI